MMAMIKLEKNPLLRAAPLIVKDAALAVADARAAREVTTTVSSLGRVALDECTAPYVEGISALTSTSGLNFIVCTYGDDLSIGISSRFLGQKVTRALAEVLEDEGMRGYLNANRDAPAFHRPGPLAAARKAAPVPSVFPPNSFERKSTRVRTVLAVLTLICIALIALLGGTAGGSALAVGAPCAAVALNWLFVRNMIVHAPDFIRVVERYFLVLLAVAGLCSHPRETSSSPPTWCRACACWPSRSTRCSSSPSEDRSSPATRSTSSTRCCSVSFLWRF